MTNFAKLPAEEKKIPSTKYQISNKSQHAAQAPALRVTQIQKSKQRIHLPLYPTA
jgi:hypothetical protein